MNLRPYLVVLAERYNRTNVELKWFYLPGVAVNGTAIIVLM